MPLLSEKRQLRLYLKASGEQANRVVYVSSVIMQMWPEGDLQTLRAHFFILYQMKNMETSDGSVQGGYWPIKTHCSLCLPFVSILNLSAFSPHAKCSRISMILTSTSDYFPKQGVFIGEPVCLLWRGSWNFTFFHKTTTKTVSFVTSAFPSVRMGELGCYWIYLHDIV